MFIRNGETLGSVLHSAASREPSTVPAPVEGPEPHPPTPHTEPSRGVERPKDYDSKAEWVLYAVASSAGTDNPVTEQDAEELTKAELIELYGGLT